MNLKKLKRKDEKGKIKENIYNLPNFFTFLRVIITFLIIFFIFTNYHLIWIAIFFVIGMLTDCLDGFIARKFNKKTEFGRKFDMIADRFLLLGVIAAFFIKFGINGILTQNHILQIILISLRELLDIPFAIILLYRKKGLVPNASWIGKSATVMQAISFPLLILYILYPRIFGFSINISLLTALVGIFAVIKFIRYSLK